MVLVAHNLYELLKVEAKQFIKLSPTLDRWLGIIYLVKFLRMYRLFAKKNNAKLYDYFLSFIIRYLHKVKRIV